MWTRRSGSPSLGQFVRRPEAIRDRRTFTRAVPDFDDDVVPSRVRFKTKTIINGPRPTDTTHTWRGIRTVRVSNVISGEEIAREHVRRKPASTNIRILACGARGEVRTGERTGVDDTVEWNARRRSRGAISYYIQSSSRVIEKRI